MYIFQNYLYNIINENVLQFIPFIIDKVLTGIVSDTMENIYYSQNINFIKTNQLFVYSYSIIVTKRMYYNYYRKNIKIVRFNQQIQYL